MAPDRAFADRYQAGRHLAAALGGYRGRSDVVVLALPRGGVPVASEVAASLAAPIDVLSVRKLGVPGHAELAMGAIAAGGARVLNDDVIGALDLSDATIAEVAAREQVELDRRQRLFRGDRPFPDLEGRTVLLVDDGLATGATMRAALRAVRERRARLTVVAVPIGSPAACRDLTAEADAVVCVQSPEPFRAVGQWYLDFSAPTDDEIRRLLGVDAGERRPS